MDEKAVKSVEQVEFVSPEEARRMLRVGRTAIYSAIEQGLIPSVRVGRLLRIPKSALTHPETVQRVLVKKAG